MANERKGRQGEILNLAEGCMVSYLSNPSHITEPLLGRMNNKNLAVAKMADRPRAIWGRTRLLPLKDGGRADLDLTQYHWDQYQPACKASSRSLQPFCHSARVTDGPRRTDRLTDTSDSFAIGLARPHRSAKKPSACPCRMHILRISDNCLVEWVVLHFYHSTVAHCLTLVLLFGNVISQMTMQIMQICNN